VYIKLRLPNYRIQLQYNIIAAHFLCQSVSLLLKLPTQVAEDPNWSSYGMYRSIQIILLTFCPILCCPNVSSINTVTYFSFLTISENTRSVNKVMRLIQYNSVLTFKLQIEFVPFKIVPLGGYTPPETLFPLFLATLVVANRNRF
jgi:hypothetical protein